MGSMVYSGFALFPHVTQVLNLRYNLNLKISTISIQTPVFAGSGLGPGLCRTPGVMSCALAGKGESLMDTHLKRVACLYTQIGVLRLQSSDPAFATPSWLPATGYDCS